MFYFNLQDAIVRRLNENDTEFFINAGGTKQLGTELQSSFWLIKQPEKSFLNGLLLRNSFTYSHFKFDQFQNAGNDFSGNDLIGVPKHTVVSSLELNFAKGFYLFAQHNYTSSIPLNDANTAFADEYHLVEIKTGIRNLNIGKKALAFSLGINNLLNQTYSLGNDLNAAANRYFNPAMNRNYYATIGLTL